MPLYQTSAITIKQQKPSSPPSTPASLVLNPESPPLVTKLHLTQQESTTRNAARTLRTRPFSDGTKIKNASTTSDNDEDIEVN
jgi:hypothetical protein